MIGSACLRDFRVSPDRLGSRAHCAQATLLVTLGGNPVPHSESIYPAQQYCPPLCIQNCEHGSLLGSASASGFHTSERSESSQTGAIRESDLFSSYPTRSRTDTNSIQFHKGAAARIVAGFTVLQVDSGAPLPAIQAYRAVGYCHFQAQRCRPNSAAGNICYWRISDDPLDIADFRNRTRSCQEIGTAYWVLTPQSFGGPQWKATNS